MESLLLRIPGVAKPIKRLNFKTRMIWTSVIVLLYFVMTEIRVFGAGQPHEQLAAFEVLLGAKFGSLMTLGIGPIVTASIILQLLVGSKILNWDMRTSHGKILFQGWQKLLAMTFTVIEAAAFTLGGTINPISFAPTILGAIILQLTLGGWLVIFMDEVVSKWGIGSGVSLFILAGVSKQIFSGAAVGISSMADGILQGAPIASFTPVLLQFAATITVFALVVYAQAMRVEIPMAFAAVRGFGQRWPLKFIYTSNIPVILVAALLVSVRLFATTAANAGQTWLAQVDEAGNIIGGVFFFLIPPNSIPIQVFSLILGIFVVLGMVIAYFVLKERVLATISGFAGLGVVIGYYATTMFYGVPQLVEIGQAVTYMMFFILGSVLFGILWVNTAGMDPHSVAQQIQGAGLQIPGFRRDPRIIEHVLRRYIPPLTILGAAFVGFLAAFADFTRALAAGTSILLAVMIVYQLYEQIAYQYMEDMHPMLRRFIAKE